ncbi:MAG: hypothetical protein JXJ04_21995 [Spirochaetales bacterium]|nr:hypothetical protein [Spirochaetales bacterium]
MSPLYTESGYKAKMLKAEMLKQKCCGMNAELTSSCIWGKTRLPLLL